MKKLSLFVLAVTNIILASTAFVSLKNRSSIVEVSQSEIFLYVSTYKNDIGTKLPLQTDCCYPDDPTTTTVGHGARCVSGSQYCVPNPCSSGTQECETKD